MKALGSLLLGVTLMATPSSAGSIQWSGPQNIEMGPGPGPDWGGIGNTYIDYDGDSITDIRLRYSDVAFLAIPQLGPDGLMNEITAEQRVTRPRCWPLDYGTELGPELPGSIIWHPEEEPLIEWMWDSSGVHAIGTWYNTFNRYMGVRFDTGAGDTHHGWVQMTVYGEFGGAIVHDWAWNTTPGEAILAGQVPEPASWALFLVGGPLVLLAYRRHRLGH